MAVHAGFANRLFFVLCRVEGSLARFSRSMAGDTVHIRHKHETGGIRNANPSCPAIKLLGTHMGLFAVASIAIGGGMSNRRNLADLVPERRMTGDTFDLVIRYMFSVERLRGILGDKDLRFVMAFKALSLRHMGIPLNDTEMTLLARNPSLDILAVIEIPAFDIDIAFGLNMAGGAASNGAGNAILFSLWTGLIVVADETVDFMNGEMGALDDLGMAGGAAEFHPPSQFLEMFPVGEGHILIDHVSLEIFRLMTSLLEAGRIADLCMGLARFLSGDEVGKRDLSIHPLPLQMVEKPRLVVALGAGDMAVAGGLPGFDIGTHLVTDATEGGGL